VPGEWGRLLCSNPAFARAGEPRFVDDGRLAECAGAETAAGQLADVLGAARAWATADVADMTDDCPNLGEARRALHLALRRAEGVPLRDGASVPLATVPGLETIAGVRRERAEALAELATERRQRADLEDRLRKALAILSGGAR
jgi:hypothetical protein